MFVVATKADTFIIDKAEGCSSKGDRFVKQMELNDGYVAAKWKNFKSQFTKYGIAKKFMDKSEEK